MVYMSKTATAECKNCGKGIRRNARDFWGARKRDDPHPWYCDASQAGKRHEPALSARAAR